MKKYFTSEQVSCGHPDKVCDQISDALLDAYLENDKNSRVAIETLIKNNNIVVAGEVTSQTEVDINQVIHNVLKDIGIDGQYDITNLIDKQSPDIAQGVDIGGAGDQGIMFGYACDETEELLPLAYVLATKALINLRDLKHPQLRPDAKSQVTLVEENGEYKIDTFLISTQHSVDITQEELREIVKNVMVDLARQYNLNTDFKVLVNPTGRFVIGGSYGDCGVTGRKIIADSYGGYAKHGGGCLSSKDPTKVDRSGAYIARYLAKYVVNKYHCHECETQLAYAIGIAEPVSISVKCKSDNLLFSENEVINDIKENFDLTPNGIINFLDLKNVKYYDTAKYGHFMNQNFNWEVLK